MSLSSREPGVSPGSLLAFPHHDGSALYQPDVPTAGGEPFEVLLRVPRAEGVNHVVVRQVQDEEPLPVVATIDRQDEHEVWWRATLTAHNIVSRYRFLLDSGPNRYRWITACGPVDHDVPDADDFHVSRGPSAPEWAADQVVYQIFPDRFARSGRVELPTPEWARPADWDDPPVYSGPGTRRQLFGGDLYGVTEHLDHVAALGATTIYLTPVFPGQSNHRYDASTFNHVDPILGGDPAYRELIDAVHARGMRILGDLTTNHTGAGHEWFQAAQADQHSLEAGFYLFENHPDDYVSWLGVRSLPKLDYRNTAVRSRLLSGPESVVRRWLDFGLDGWRIDVAQMTGRHMDTDINREVSQLVAAEVAAAGGKYLVGENVHDFRADAGLAGWHGVMNYSGFTKPLWTWLVRPQAPFDTWFGLPIAAWPNLPGPSVAATMRAYSGVPWNHQLASMTLISSHDSPRIATITDDPALVEVAVAAMFTHPGIPMIWAGDEVGSQGVKGEDGRRPFPWHRPEVWNRATLSAYQRLAELRGNHVALRRGGLRWAFVDNDRLVWLREHPHESILVQLARRPGEPINLSAPLLGFQDEGQSAQNLYGGAHLTSRAGIAQLPGDGPTVQIWRLPGSR